MSLPVFSEVRPIGHHLLTDDDFFVGVMKIIGDIQRFTEDEHNLVR